MAYKLLIASSNKGKLHELQALLDGLPIELLLPSQLGITLDVPEDGNTYAENAAKKALAYCKASNLTTLADDSGLEVDALNGAPGLYSNRFTNIPNASDADRRQYLLARLQGQPRPWTAHFHCTVAIAVPGGRMYYSEGNCPGEIIPEERGTNGFGYDPIFRLQKKALTMAELGMEEKNLVSHRARAVIAAQPVIQELCR
jgi:XTP/dITP diphosphohydrolase